MEDKESSTWNKFWEFWGKMFYRDNLSVTVMWQQTLEFEPPHDKTNKMTVRPAKTQISLGIRPVWSKSSLCTQWVAKDPNFLHADSEDSDQTGRIPSLCWAHMPFCWFCHAGLIFSHFITWLQSTWKVFLKEEPNKANITNITWLLGWHRHTWVLSRGRGIPIIPLVVAGIT